MENDKTVEVKDEKDLEEVDTSKKDETTVDETTENTNDKSKEDKKEVVEKEEEIDPYEAKLKEVQEKLETEKTINRQKTGALKDERDKDKAIKALEDKLTHLEEEIKSGDEWEDDKPSKPEIDTSNFVSKDEITKLQNQIKVQKELNEISSKISTTAEKKLIDIYVDKGYSVKDAYLKANEHLIDKLKSEKKERIDKETLMLDMNGGQNYSKTSSPEYLNTKKKKEVGDFLDSIGVPDAKKFIK